MIALAYLACVAVALVVLAVALRHRPTPPAPTPTPPVPAPALTAIPGGADAEVRVILTAAHQLAARLAA